MSIGEIDQCDKKYLVEGERVDYVTSSSPRETVYQGMYGSPAGNKESLDGNNERDTAAREPTLSSNSPRLWGGEQVSVTLPATEHSSTEVLFPALVDAGVAVRNSLFDLLRRDSTPEVVCKVGFREYEATGQERCLLLTASLLEDFGETAWPVLKELAASKRPECELFVGLIAHCDDVSSNERASALGELAAHPDPVVRLTILGDLSDLSVDDTRSVLRSLTDDSDDDVREEARQRLLDTQ